MRLQHAVRDDVHAGEPMGFMSRIMGAHLSNAPPAFHGMFDNPMSRLELSTIANFHEDRTS